MVTTISIGKDSHSIPIMDMDSTHKTHLNNIQSFDLLPNILRGQLGSHPVADIVTDLSNSIPTETAAAYEEARTVSKVVEGAATKAEYIDGIGFLN